MTSERPLILGAVAYDPKVVTIWDGFRRWFQARGLPMTYVLYAHYEHQVEDLLAGKIDVEDVPLFGRLMREGIVTAPDYMPDWARDLSHLTAFMSYSAFLGECDLVAERRRYEDLLARAEYEMP